MEIDAEKLKQEIEDRKKQLLDLEEKQRQKQLFEIIKPLEEYTLDEKAAWFDGVYKVSLKYLKDKKNGNFPVELDTLYDWEANMEILARDSTKFWEYWKSLG